MTTAQDIGWIVGAERKLYVGVTGTVTAYDAEAGVVTIGTHDLPVAMNAWDDVRVHYLSTLDPEIPESRGCDCGPGEGEVSLDRFRELRNRFLDAIRSSHEDRHGCPWRTCDDTLCRLAREDDA